MIDYPTGHKCNFQPNCWVDAESNHIPLLECGHPRLLLVKSVESDYQFCELCEARRERNDALEMERTYKARAEAAEEQKAAAEKLRDAFAEQVRISQRDHAETIKRAEAAEARIAELEEQKARLERALQEIEEKCSGAPVPKDRDWEQVWWERMNFARRRAGAALSPAGEESGK